jgi:hypothetical protein
MKKDVETLTKSKEKKRRFNIKSNKFTILDKIAAIENKEAIKSMLVFIAMIICLSFALSFGSYGYSILGEMLRNLGVYSIQVLFRLLFMGVFSYICMCILGFIAIVCYDENVYRYGEIAVKISKFTILFIVVTMFKESIIIGALKDFVF